MTEKQLVKYIYDEYKKEGTEDDYAVKMSLIIAQKIKEWEQLYEVREFRHDVHRRYAQ